MTQLGDSITCVDSLKDRLKQARKEAGFENQRQLAEAAGVSVGAVGMFESGRRANPRKLLQIAAALGVNPEWLLEGTGPRRAAPADAGGNEGTHPHPMNIGAAKVLPPVVQWGELMAAEPMPEFETQLPDNAMAPEAPKGTRVIFVTGIDPEPGDWVLITDATGQHYCREYRQLRPGHWEAHARNPGFLPMESERDGLRVVAVFDGMRGRRSPR